MSHCSVYVSTVKIKAENELEIVILFELSPAENCCRIGFNFLGIFFLYIEM